MRYWLLLVSFAFLFCCTGCNDQLVPPTDPAQLNDWISKHKSSIKELVQTGAQWGTEKGLESWAKQNPAGAKEAALALTQNIDNQIIPYFKDGAKLLTADEVKQLLSSSLFKNVPPVVKIAIVAASACLDYYLPIPQAQLTQDQKDIICAFLQGVRDGCEDFTSVPGTKEIKTPRKHPLPAKHWIE